MKKILLILSATLLLGGCSPKELFVKPPAGLEITTTPVTTVFLNGENKGTTPFSDKAIKPGTYTLKLVPEEYSDTLPPYETSLTLISRTSTVISRNLAATDVDVSGYTLELQQENANQTYLSIISDPDTINVTIDGKPNGFTPLSKIETTPGSHSLHVTSPGFIPQEISINTVKGYNLIVNFKLGSQTITLTSPAIASASAGPQPKANLPGEDTITATKSSSLIAKPYVVIEETGTGWLRVRKNPSGTAEELGKANTGEKLLYLGESTELGWLKVQFEGSVGWVSGKYVTLVK